MNAVRIPTSSDATAIATAAEGLGISEFDFFRVAYRRWSGREADESSLEKIFVVYMFEQSAPHWARHLCRDVLQRRRTGRLDPHAFGITELMRRQPLPRLGRFSWSMMAMGIVIVLLISFDTTYVKNRNFPPGCPGFSGSLFLDNYVGPWFKKHDAVCPPFAYPARDEVFGLK
ncbi:MAG: hypothetical protein HYW28_07555 [Rhodospirillales bacterium]|nr:hypothetical protein [Rhodospirillales bacterium]